MPRIEYEDFVGGRKRDRGRRPARIHRAVEPLTGSDVEAAVRRLPALPALLHELMRELRDENADIGRLEERISSDPSLTTRVLKMANSPFYVRSSEVVDVKRAVLSLGFRTVSNLVMAAGLRNTISSSESVPGFVASGIFLHSLAVGMGCSRLARGLTQLRDEGQYLFVAGLLHDIGRVALTDFYLQRKAEILGGPSEELTPDTEREILGTDHQQVGRLVHERWGLPEELLAPITRHHAPVEELRDEPLTAVVSLVDAHLNRAGYARTRKWSGLEDRLRALCAVLDLDPESLDERIGDVGEEVSSISGSFA